jgi:hypothetical protein
MSRVHGHTYHSRSQTVILVILPFAFFIVAASIEVRPQPLHGNREAGLVAFAGFGAIIVFGCWRAAKARIVASDQGIQVQNVFSSFVLSWAEIKRFDIGRSGVWPAICRIHTHDGRVLRAWGIQESNAAMTRDESKRPASQLALSLNKELAAHTSPPRG